MAGVLITFFLVSVVVSFFVTYGVIRLAEKKKAVSKPTRPRDIHKKPIPLWGGLAIFLSLVLLIGLAYAIVDFEQKAAIPIHYLVGAFVGALILIIFGVIDDKYKLKPHESIWGPTLAAVCAVVVGMRIDLITNPFGGFLEISQWPILAIVLTFFWLWWMQYTTKLLDGLDGLASGVVLIGTLVIFFLAISKNFFEPTTALYALIFAGVLFGFLIWNFNPAKIFLGEGGSTLVGFILGVLAIVSGSKLATALLVMGVPVLDMIWVMVRRRFFEHKKVTEGDDKHLHFRLLRAGLTHRQAVFFYYFIAAGFGASSLFLQSKQKLIALISLVLIIIGVGIWVTRRRDLKHTN
ncbi:undecaprenyl/decaprenyl-phosphate alpha-N-acetylglucosaminyl 1-phosphate transferase [Candidatus Falkowbacteria bacterium]|nr:undecaprenyl/decaprenyl-phosphate alpha-N-acetylglucosaminyl 1-phosphate transferase [Candidatus Falkowbacteria bacterium]